MKLEAIVDQSKHFLDKSKEYYAAATVFALGATFDTYATITGLNYGESEEGNPLIKFFMDNIGVESGVIGVKLGITALFIYYYKSEPKTIKGFLYVAGIAQGIAGSTWYIMPELLNYLQ